MVITEPGAAGESELTGLTFPGGVLDLEVGALHRDEAGALLEQLGLPLLALSFRPARRGSLRGRLLLAGTLGIGIAPSDWLLACGFAYQAGIAVVIALVLLGSAWPSALAGGDLVRLLTQAALSGVGAFVIALIGGEMAQRLAREESAARGSLGIARQQAQLNRLVLEEMADGVLVVNLDNRPDRWQDLQAVTAGIIGTKVFRKSSMEPSVRLVFSAFSSALNNSFSSFSIKAFSSTTNVCF